MAPKADDGKNASLKSALDMIEKKFGKGAIMTLDSANMPTVETTPTGSISLDMALGNGLPVGRIVELYGPESSGKTTLSLHAVAQIQKLGQKAAFVDAEHALDPLYAQRIGVNLGELLVAQPDSGEQALEIVETLVRSGAVSLIVVDSVAALTPKAEIEGEMGDTHVGLQARLMSQALRKLTSIASQSKCTIIFLNQIRMKIGVMFGNPETTTGGNALKFYASVRMEIRRAAKIEESVEGEKEKVATGNRVKVKVVKNKVAPPFRVAEFDIMFNHGISYEGDLLDTATAADIVKKSGAFYSYKETKLGQGRVAAKEFLAANPAIAADIATQVKEMVKRGQLSPEQVAATDAEVDAEMGIEPADND